MEEKGTHQSQTTYQGHTSGTDASIDTIGHSKCLLGMSVLTAFTDWRILSLRTRILFGIYQPINFILLRLFDERARALANLYLGHRGSGEVEILEPIIMIDPNQMIDGTPANELYEILFSAGILPSDV